MLNPFINSQEDFDIKLGYGFIPIGIKGEWEKVFDCIKACHEVVHDLGAIRIYTTLKVNTRIDKKQSFREKVYSVKNAIIFPD